MLGIWRCLECDITIHYSDIEKVEGLIEAHKREHIDNQTDKEENNLQP